MAHGKKLSLNVADIELCHLVAGQQSVSLWSRITRASWGHDLRGIDSTSTNRGSNTRSCRCGWRGGRMRGEVLLLIWCGCGVQERWEGGALPPHGVVFGLGGGSMFKGLPNVYETSQFYNYVVNKLASH